jgi:hypothetical protein
VGSKLLVGCPNTICPTGEIAGLGSGFCRPAQSDAAFFAIAHSRLARTRLMACVVTWTPLTPKYAMPARDIVPHATHGALVAGNKKTMANAQPKRY